MTSNVADPFEILGLDGRFDLAKSELESRQRELSKVLHPDRFAVSSASERRVALNRAMSVNEAVRLLKDPVARGHALLKRLLTQGQTSGELPEVRVSSALLMEVMEWREELSKAARDKNQPVVEAVAATAAARRATVVTELTAAFEQLKRTPPTHTNSPEIAAIQQGLMALKYLERLSDEVRRVEDEFNDASV